MTAVTPGFTFTHPTLLDMDWRPGPGQRYADAPRALLTVTRVTRRSVYYGYASTPGRGLFVLDRDVFERRYLS